MNEDVTKLNNRNHVTSIAANAIGSDQIGSDVVLDNKTISSSNYLPGISGWMIDGFGNSEFANVLVRGDINAYSGTIGYWNISQPLVSRTFGDYVLRGTLLESSNLGLTDDGVDIGTYVGLFKSYVDTEVSITSISRDSEIATAIVLSHNYSVGDYIKVSIDEDSSFNTNSAVIVDISSTSFKYYSAGSDVVIAEATGFSILDIRDIAGLYLRDYSKAEFDYGYFSNTGVAYVSAEDVNLIENPSFEYIDSGLTPVSSNVSWTAAAGSTFSLEKFNDGTDPQFQYDSSYGGKVLWSSALSTYFAGRIDYLVGTSYNIFKSGRVLYLGMTMFPSYVATRSVPTAIARYNSSGTLYWRIDTSSAHGLSGGDTALLDFEGKQFDPTYGEWMDYMPRSVTGGTTRTYTVLASPAPTSTSFYVNSGYSSTATLGNGITLLNVTNIDPVNTDTATFGVDPYGTRPGAYVYKVLNAAFNLSEIRFRFNNGSTVNISDVASIDTRSNWDTESNKYLISDPTLYALGYNDASIGIPSMYKSVQTIIDANALQSSYESLDPTSYAAGTDIYIDLPAWTYSHDGAGYVSASPTKISSFAYILDNLYLSTTTKSFFGGSLPNVRWASSTVEDPSYDPAQASIEGTKQWINIDLDSQTAYLDYFNYVGFKQSNFSRSMLVSPNITTSDSISAKIVIPTDHETLTVTSGTYRYINNGGDYIDLVSSLKTVTGDRDTGFELVASKKYHSGVSETILAEETALIAGYWDESSSKSIVKIKAEIFTLSGQYTDYITATSSGTTIHGDLTVNGTTTTVNSTTVTVDDKNIELASTGSPSDVLADGAGITVKGTGDKTWSWIDATNSWTSNQDINIVSTGTDFRIGGTSVLNNTTLGAAIANSSLSKVAPLSGGTAGFVKVDASGNLTSTSASESMTALMGFTTTVTSGTAVVLTNASTYYQQFTGSTAQTITLPVTSTLATGWTFHIVNNNTAGDLTVNSSGGNLVITVIPGTTAMVTCIATAGTGAANWEAGLTDFSTYTGTGSVALSISPTFTGTVNTNAITAGGLASFNNNISAFGTSTFWTNQQLSLAVRNGTNYAGNLVQYSINDTTVTGGVTARGLLWAGTATGAENNFTYNLSATNPFLTSSTATFTVSTVQTYNPFAVGQRIIVSGASQAQYNGSWISTAVGGSSGAWTVTISSGSGTTPFTNSGAITATGTIALEPAAFFKAPSPGTSALVIKAAGVSGTATDPFRYFDSAGALKTYITSAGDFVAPAISAIWSITSSAQDATVNAMRTRTSLASGYKANLQTWESSTTVLAGINNRGQFFTGGTSVLSGATTATTAASASSATVATYTVGTVSTVNPYAIGQLITTAGFSAETYFNGTFYVTAIGGSSGAWTITIVGSGFTVASATVQGTITIPAQASITPASAGTIGLVVRGTTSQAANLFETQDSAGAIKFYVDSAGNSNFSSGSWFQNSTGKLAIGLSSSVIGLLIKGASGQGVDLLQLQNNGSTPLFKVDQNGFMVAGGATVLSNAVISASIYGTTQVGMAIRGTSGQTADLLVLQNNSTTSVSGFDSASNLFVNNTYYGFNTIVANPANTTYWKIATLPISTAGTYDHIIVDALLDDSWGSNQKVHARVLLGNRNGFTYRYYLNGTVRTNSRITVYTEADGSESVYMQLAASTYSAFSYNITHGIAGVIIYKNPTSTTTAPTGTLAFDSGNIATYIPQMYVPYTGAPQIQGNSISYTTHTHGNVLSGGTMTTSVTATNPVKVVITDSGNVLGTLTTTGASGTTFLRGDGTWATPVAGTGTVTSVGMTVPTGLSVTPSTITTSGTFAVTYSVGYAIPTTSDVSNGVTAYGWGNHASAGYLTTSTAASTYQPLDTDLTAIAALTGTSGFLKTNGAGTWSVDTATYLTSLGVGSSTQAWDADLDAISTISTTGILKRTGTNTWATITDNSTNWDTAFGWGNHASAGYLTTRSYVGQTQTTASGTNMAVTGITSITGATGTTDIAFNSAATTSAASGAINVITGTTTTSGTTGATTLRSGNSAAASGAVTVSTGTAVATTSGTLTLSTGNASGTGGVSGAISIATGAAGSTGNSGAITMDVGTKTTGSFGTITIGGTNASAIAIGNATNTATTNLISSTSINLNSPAINSNAATLALLATSTTITAGAAATAVTIGASTGTLTLNNPTITTSVISGTLALFNTGLTGTLSIGGAAGTINIGASTTSKTINIGTATTTGNSSTIRIGTAQAATTSDIYLQGVVYLGKDVTGTGNQTGYTSQVIASGVTATGLTGNATGGSLDIRSGGAALSDINNGGNATSGNITMDVGSASTTGGAPLYGTITIGQFNASAVNIGRSGVTTTINGSIVANTAATSTTSQLRLVTGTVPTTASQQFGMISADAESIQLATTKTTGAGAGFGFIRAPQMVYAIANSGAATTNTAVSPFASTNDVLSSLEVNKYYRFRGVYYFTSTFTSGTATIQLAFTFANGPVTFKYNYKTYKSTGVTTFDLAGVSTTNAATTISASVTATASYAVEFEGFFTSNATTGGSLTPQFQMSTTGSSTIATAGSFFEIEKLNATGATTPGLIAGNWA
jgi:hypothetical protein